MKKFIIAGIALCISSTAALAQPEWGDATYLPPQKTTSDLTRAEVLAKTDSTNIANNLESTYSPTPQYKSVLSRADVIRKMEGFQFADFGDGTNLQPWVRKSEAPRALAKEGNNKAEQSSN